MNQDSTTVIMSARLLCQVGGADKEYVAKVIQCGSDLYHVRGYSGRRGSALKEQIKTKEPVSIDVATQEYNKLIKSKLGGHYQFADDTSKEFQQIRNPLKLVDGHTPSLPVAVTLEDVIRMIADPRWAAQEKMDGERRQAATKGDVAVGTNRKASEVPLPLGVLEDLCNARSVDGDIHLDTEIIGHRLYAFDLLAYGADGNIKSWPFRKRIELLHRISCDFGSDITFVPVAYSAEEKQALFDRVKAANGEGLVFKLLDGAYIEGNNGADSNVVKFKFYEEATVKVVSIHPTKQSVGIAVVGADGTDHNVGNLTIPANATPPVVGDFVNARYLYLYDGGSLFQPTYSRPRPDKDVADSLSSLKVKPGAPA